MNFFLKTFFLIFFLCSNVFATNIAVIKINYIINNVPSYNIFINKLLSDKKITEETLQNKEKDLLFEKNEINESRLILSESEIDKLINIYQQKVQNFQSEVLNHNQYFDKNIDHNKNKVLQEIIKIITLISDERNYDLVLNENNYFLASDTIDLSGEVISLLNDIEISYELID